MPSPENSPNGSGASGGAGRSFAGRLDRWFGIGGAGSTPSREVLGGLTTFATMSYIIFVQPTILSAAGMPFGSVLLATCLASALGCLLMGLYARYPYALAPGMGENFLFAFTVCGAMGFSWNAGLTIVLLSGVVFLALVGARRRLVEVMPATLRLAMGPAIGLFIAFVGLQWGGIVVDSPATLVTLSGYPPGPPLLTLLGVAIITAAIARRFQGGLLLGILITAGVGLATGVLPWPDTRPAVGFETFFAFDWSEVAAKWDQALIAAMLFLLLDFFDTTGTVVGLSTQAGLMKPGGELPRARRAFLSDAVATCAGAAAGTSTITTYIESATGIAAGARTGLAAVVAGLCFLAVAVAAPVLAPIVVIAGQDVGPAFYGVDPTAPHVAMYPCVAPALIVVGVLMLRPLRDIPWDDFTEALPAFAMLILMPLGFGIIEGISAGFIAYPVVKLLAGRPGDAHPIIWGAAAALAARYFVA
jgi:AGZA family xanthine/uracil permease-like MFS transporter